MLDMVVVDIKIHVFLIIGGREERGEGGKEGGRWREGGKEGRREGEMERAREEVR